MSEKESGTVLLIHISSTHTDTVIHTWTHTLTYAWTHKQKHTDTDTDTHTYTPNNFSIYKGHVLPFWTRSLFLSQIIHTQTPRIIDLLQVCWTLVISLVNYQNSGKSLQPQPIPCCLWSEDFNTRSNLRSISSCCPEKVVHTENWSNWIPKLQVLLA